MGIGARVAVVVWRGYTWETPPGSRAPPGPGALQHGLEFLHRPAPAQISDPVLRVLPASARRRRRPAGAKVELGATSRVWPDASLT